MKHLMIIPLFLLVFSVSSQTKPIKVVFDVTSSDESIHKMVMRHVTLMAEAYPESEFAVVVYGGALPMLVNGSSTVSQEILQFKNNEKISILACEGTMKRFEVKNDQLLSGVKSVRDGLYELAIKQSEGWAYIKESN
ncbi:MAG TPA: DsrE family protein [Anditalea sp.]|nr:DsrE family protein [Anditalea sp.]